METEVIENQIDNVKILPYFDNTEYFKEDTIVSIWHYLRMDGLIDDTFHCEVNTLNGFMHLMLNSAIFLGTVNDEFAGFAWLTDKVGKRAIIGLAARRKFHKKEVIRQLCNKLFNMIFEKFDIDLLYAYVNSKSLLSFAERIGGIDYGVIPEFFGDGSDAHLVWIHRKNWRAQ